MVPIFGESLSHNFFWNLRTPKNWYGCLHKIYFNKYIIYCTLQKPQIDKKISSHKSALLKHVNVSALDVGQKKWFITKMV